MENLLLKSFCSAVRPPDRRPIWQWAEEHFEVDKSSVNSGKFRASTAPWTKEVMDCYQDPTIRTVATQCSAQSSKSQTAMICLSHTIAEDPGPTMWVVAAQDEAKQFHRDRLEPTFDACEPVRQQFVKVEDNDYIFQNMVLYFTGSHAKSKLQGKPIRNLFLDEVRNYPKGALSMVQKRIRTYSYNSKQFIISTPGNKNDELDQAFRKGDQRVYHVCCPKCSIFQPLVWDQLKWDTNETTKPKGKWNMDELRKTIRYECKSCQHEIRDVPFERKSLAASGKWVRTNPDAPSDYVSFTWNAILPPWVSWASLVEEYIVARRSLKAGDKEPMKTFYTETLGIPWEDELGVITDFSFLEDRRADYDFGDSWPEEIGRFMAADRQAAGGEHYWYVVRSFGKFAKSRLVAFGRCNTKVELEELRKLYRVPIRNAVIDSGYRANEVYRFCAATGWKPFKGDPAENFLVKNSVTGKPVRRCFLRTWTRPEGVRSNPGTRKSVKLYRWSNPWVKDILYEQIAGLVGEWTVPRKVGKDYMRQMMAERREMVLDAYGYERAVWKQIMRDNHFFDCECMIAVAAVASGIMSAGNRIAESA